MLLAVLALLGGGYASNSLSIISCCPFHNFHNAYPEKLIETCIFFLNNGYYDWIYMKWSPLFLMNSVPKWHFTHRMNEAPHTFCSNIHITRVRVLSEPMQNYDYYLVEEQHVKWWLSHIKYLIVNILCFFHVSFNFYKAAYQSLTVYSIRPSSKGAVTSTVVPQAPVHTAKCWFMAN